MSDNCLVDLREIHFVLFDIFRVHEIYLGESSQTDEEYRDEIESLLQDAVQFGERMSRSYQEADYEGCTLTPDGTVKLPGSFYTLWSEYRKNWSPNTLRKRLGGSKTGQTQCRLPPILSQIIYEILMGANPAFMTYGGFNVPAAKLILRNGTDDQRNEFLSKLLTLEWDACFCATEPQAGSNLFAVKTTGEEMGEGIYRISGEKIFISAGMHNLTENTLYFVLGRCSDELTKPYALSCFIVPKYMYDREVGKKVRNNIECIKIEEKMGLRGCSNAHLMFGRRGPTLGWLLGDKSHVALLQLSSLMKQGRIATGIFSLGIASRAYLHALYYAQKRVQGQKTEKLSDLNLPGIPIIEHADVQRMILEMRSKTEGCRILLGKVGLYFSDVALAENSAEEQDERNVRMQKLGELLTPVIKAYVSDEAWRICELSIQVHGGRGYMKDLPVEQFARDVKVMSIWEGTNYIQAYNLVRERLSFGRKSVPFCYLTDEIDAFLSQVPATSCCAQLCDELRQAREILADSLGRINQLAQAGEHQSIEWFATRFLSMLAETSIAWGLIEAAQTAERLMSQLEPLSPDRNFLAAKIDTARFYVYNIMPNVATNAKILENSTRSVISVEASRMY